MWTKQKGRCGTPGCILKDFHDGPCSHLNLSDGVVRSRKHVCATVLEFSPRPVIKTTPRKKRLRADHGEVCEVERLLASRVSGGRRQYVVRWKQMSAKHDSWEPEEEIEQALIAEFASTRNYKAPYRGGLYLVDQVLEHKQVGAKRQSKVKWFGYDWKASWFDDDKLVAPTPEQTPPSTGVAAGAPPPPVAPTERCSTKFCIEKGPACGQIPRKARFCPECGAAQQ